MIFDLVLTCCSPLLLTIGSDFQFTFSFRISCWDFNDCPAPVTNPPTLSPTRTPLTRRPTISTQESPSSGGLPIPIMFIIFPVVAIGSILVLAGVGKYCRRRNSAADINDINNIAQPISSTTNTKGNNDMVLHSQLLQIVLGSLHCLVIIQRLHMQPNHLLVMMRRCRTAQILILKLQRRLKCLSLRMASPCLMN